MQRGFTLLEMLVVVAMLAILSVSVSLTLTNRSTSSLKLESERLRTLLELALDESRIAGAALLWTTTDTGYRFDRATTADDDVETFTPQTDERLRARSLPAEVRISTVQSEGRVLEAGTPIAFAAGTVLPFHIELTQAEYRLRIEAGADGRIQLRDLSLEPS